MQSGLGVERLRASSRSDIAGMSYSDLTTMLAECAAVHVEELRLLKLMRRVAHTLLIMLACFPAPDMAHRRQYNTKRMY